MALQEMSEKTGGYDTLVSSYDQSYLANWRSARL